MQLQEIIDLPRYFLVKINVSFDFVFNFLDDFSVDLWSLGCIIAEIYLGHQLFDGSVDME